MSGTVTVASLAADGGNNNKKVMLKNCAPFTYCVRKISNTQVDNAKDFYIVMPMHSLIQYIDNYLKVFVCLWQYYRDKQSLNNANVVIDFTAANQNSKSFNYKQKITVVTNANGSNCWSNGTTKISKWL